MVWKTLDTNLALSSLYKILQWDVLCEIESHSKQDVVAAVVILRNICRTWTMYLCMDSVKFLFEAPGASILWGLYYFVTAWKPIRGRFYKAGRF